MKSLFFVVTNYGYFRDDNSGESIKLATKKKKNKMVALCLFKTIKKDQNTKALKIKKSKDKYGVMRIETWKYFMRFYVN